jgi:AcrR family transcriptional regulator
MPKQARLRDEHARATRDAVIAAAHALFVENGYASTSIRAVAARARVAEQTVYRLFDTKAGLLREAVLAAVSGTSPGTTGADEAPLMAAIAAAATPTERLAVIAGWIGEGYRRGVAELEEVVFSAADADPRVRDLARFVREQRYRDVRSMVDAVLEDATLPSGLDLGDVADYIYAVESSPVYRQLVVERGWTTDKYVAWFTRMVERLFLSDLQPAPGGRRGT